MSDDITYSIITINSDYNTYTYYIKTNMFLFFGSYLSLSELISEDEHGQSQHNLIEHEDVPHG